MAQIDTSKLQVGQVYSYKQLCELTGAEYKKGRSRTLQMQNFSENGFPRFFDFEKVGYGKYQVTDIYPIPLDIRNNRNAGNASVYLLYIELIILRYLAADYNRETIFSRKRLWKLLGMINEKYGVIENEKLLQIDKVITPFEIDNFYFRANHKLDRILKTAIKNLSDRSLIDATPRTMICKEINGMEQYQAATDDEIAIILKIERQILDDFNCETISQIVMKKRHKDFFKEVNEILYDKYRWKYFYKAYSIVFNKSDIKRFIPRLEMSLKDALCKLNLEIIDALNKEAETLYDRKLNEYDECVNNSDDEDSFIAAVRHWKYPMNYVIAQKILANELINISTNEDINIYSGIDTTFEDNEINELFAINENE